MKRILLALTLLLVCLLAACQEADTTCEPSDNGTPAPSPTPCPHTWGAWSITKPATCKESGLQERVCGTCKEIETQPLPKTDEHVPVTDAAVEATCKSSGLTEGSHCGVCQKVLVSQESTSKTDDHSYAGGLCTVCGQTREASKGLAFERSGNGYALAGLGSCTDDVLIIPSTYQGLPVTEIRRGAIAFFDYRIREIIVSGGITLRYEAISTPCFFTLTLGSGVSVEECAIDAMGGCEILNGTGRPLYFSVFLGTCEGRPYLIHTDEQSRTEVNADGFVFLTADGTTYLCDYLGESDDLTLPASHGTKGYVIAPNAFRYCQSIGHVTLGSGVTALGEGAFCHSSLSSIDLSGTVSEIPTFCFEGCSELGDVVIPQNIAVIQNQAFAASGVRNVTLPTGLRSVNVFAFNECKRLETLYYNATDCTVFASSLNGFRFVVIGKDVRAIPKNFMKQNANLCTLTFESGSACTSIGASAFKGTSLEAVTIPRSVTSLACAFEDCSRLSTVFYNAANATASNAFDNCGTDVGGVVLIVGAEVTKIPTKLFYSTTVKRMDFAGESVCKTVEEGFSTKKVSNATLPPCVESFSAADFDAASLTLDGNGYFTAESGCIIRNSDNALLAVIDQNYTIPAYVTKILSGAFSGSGVRHIEIPETVQYLEAGCLDCDTLRSVSLPFVGTSRENPTMLLELFTTEHRYGYRAVDLGVAGTANVTRYYVPPLFDTLILPEKPHETALTGLWDVIKHFNTAM